jgi:hypothetical protein
VFTFAVDRLSPTVLEIPVSLQNAGATNKRQSSSHQPEVQFHPSHSLNPIGFLVVCSTRCIRSRWIYHDEVTLNLTILVSQVRPVVVSKMRRVSVVASKSWRSAQLLYQFQPATPKCRACSPGFSIQQPQQRYATTRTWPVKKHPGRESRGVRTAARPAPKPSRVAEELLVFEPQDAPPMSFWENMADFCPEGLSTEELHRIATQYVAVAVQRSGGSTWKGQLQRGRHQLALAGAVQGDDGAKRRCNTSRS